MASSNAELMKQFNRRTAAVYNSRVQLAELKNPAGYELVSVRTFTHRDFGDCVVATVLYPEAADEDDRLRDVFLPERFNEVFNQRAIASYNSFPNLKLKYLGKGKRNEHLGERLNKE